MASDQHATQHVFVHAQEKYSDRDIQDLLVSGFALRCTEGHTVAATCSACARTHTLTRTPITLTRTLITPTRTRTPIVGQVRSQAGTGITGRSVCAKQLRCG